MDVQFKEAEHYQGKKYNENNNPTGHLIACQNEWVHAFFHTLDKIPRRWYISVELPRENTTWDDLTIYFSHTFSFVSDDPIMHNALHHIQHIVSKMVRVKLPKRFPKAPIT